MTNLATVRRYLAGWVSGGDERVLVETAAEGGLVAARWMRPGPTAAEFMGALAPA
jgi:hypothetical protein